MPAAAARKEMKNPNGETRYSAFGTKGYGVAKNYAAFWIANAEKGNWGRVKATPF